MPNDLINSIENMSFKNDYRNNDNKTNRLVF